MRAGCLGCLTLLLVVALAAGGTWAAFRMFDEPGLKVTEGTPEDGRRAQRKILEIARAGRSDPVILTEPEVNAFLSRHLADAAGIPMTDLAVRLGRDGIVDIKGRLPLGRVARTQPLAWLAALVPTRWLDHPVWLHIGTRPRVEPTLDKRQRHLYLNVERFALGRQPLPALTLRFLLDPVALRALAWPMPEGVGSITVEAGRAVIRPASSR